MSILRSRKILVLGVLLLTGTLALAAESPQSRGEQMGNGWTVEQVVALLKEGREPSVSFEEATYSSLLTEPLIVRGVLRFTPPSTLEKEVLEPDRERYVIEGDRVTYENERKRVKKTISLEDYPALRSFVEAFRASFTGDVARLKQVYDTTVEGSSRQWALLLRPRDSAGRSMVESLTLAGSEGQIATITIRSPDGDRSVMTLSRGPAK
ncbi:LolA-related protein [Nitrospira sp. NS4]|uniref:LolA-related protein n=1 Tax=Nitrospira sp. NS4 TaxID=3414498 RepID=UPI003C2F9452